MSLASPPEQISLGDLHLRSIILFGAGGQLGSSIARVCSVAHPHNLITVPWAQAGKWRRDDVAAWFSRENRAAADVIIANGLTDPSRPKNELDHSNTEFPLRVIEAGASFPGLRFMTIGTVMEERASLSTANAYVASKLALCHRVEELAQQGLAGRLLHLRLHTLYGVGRPHPHMFLGQMLTALKSESAFSMSSGRQYRQYHHAEDIAMAISALTGRDWFGQAVLQMNSAETLQLRRIAEAVFRHFGKSSLLQIGAVPEQTGEVIEDPGYAPTEAALFPRSRPAIPGIINWLSECLGR
ncbi:MAG TPA: NAD-dependent epimerase/dehydratase family protein [Terriglobales bacterium]|nr:NAD-dependent epimerase/dehydratase family protein [Terriglobales bacterium]